MSAPIAHPVWQAVAPYITRGELNRPDDMHPETLMRLHRVRLRSGVSFRFVSDARLGEAGVSNSAHNERPCTAVDLRVHNSSERFRLVEAALAEGFRRIGVYAPTPSQARQWGKNAGTVHLDDSPRLPRDVMWVAF